MRLPSTTRRTGLTAIAFAAGLGLLVAAPPAGAESGALTVSVSVDGAAFSTTIELTCESPAAPAANGVDIGGAAVASRHDLSVPANGTTSVALDGVADGSACAVTAAGPQAASLTSADGGTALVGADGHLRGVAVTVDRGTPVTAHLTFTIPIVLESTASRTEAPSTTTTTGSGSAAPTPPLLPASDEAASAAAPVALAAARSTTTSSSAALPDTSGSGTVLVLASLGILGCGALAYAMVVVSRHTDRF
jgi:hypothetical protein